jgi:hypothetical protein
VATAQKVIPITLTKSELCVVHIEHDGRKVPQIGTKTTTRIAKYVPGSSKGIRRLMRLKDTGKGELLERQSCDLAVKIAQNLDISPDKEAIKTAGSQIKKLIQESKIEKKNESDVVVLDGAMGFLGSIVVAVAPGIFIEPVRKAMLAIGEKVNELVQPLFPAVKSTATDGYMAAVLALSVLIGIAIPIYMSIKNRIYSNEQQKIIACQASMAVEETLGK